MYSNGFFGMFLEFAATILLTLGGGVGRNDCKGLIDICEKASATLEG